MELYVFYAILYLMFSVGFARMIDKGSVWGVLFSPITTPIILLSLGVLCILVNIFPQIKDKFDNLEE